MKPICTSTMKLTSTSPPGEFRIWPFGEIETTKGTFLLDEAGAAAVLASAAAYGNKLTFDYNHAAVLQVGDTPSAGSFELEVRGDGLWAVRCEWTSNAAQRLSAKEYLYFSPAFYVDDQGRIIELTNIALTNLPATKNMEPLVATLMNRRQVRAAMSFDDIYAKLAQAIQTAYGYEPYLSEVFDEYAVFRASGVTYAVGYSISGNTISLTGDPTEVSRQYQEVPGGKTMNKALLLSLKLAESATEADAVLAAKTLSDRQSEIVTLTGAASITEAVGVLHAWKEKAARTDAAEAQLASVTGERERETREALLTQAQKDGKIAPAQLDFWRGQPLETLTGFLKAASPVVQTGQHGADETQRPVHLSDSGLKIASMLGVKPEDLAARAAKGN